MAKKGCSTYILERPEKESHKDKKKNSSDTAERKAHRKKEGGNRDLEAAMILID